ncbi:MAG: class I SAM-dependent methyltransferase [Stackebrandtia sp.]
MSLRRTISRSRLAPVALFPVRLARVFRHDRRVVGRSIKWLFTSREHHNYTYDLTKINRGHLAWYISAICDVDVKEVRGYLDEVEQDAQLAAHITSATAGSSRRGLADRTARYARRMGWYALVRIQKPEHIVETGVDKGLGSCVLAAALRRNTEEGSPGRLTAVDINPEAGYLVRSGPYADIIDLVINDSIATIKELDRPVDLFIHDSDHAVEHETREFTTVEPKLADDAVLLTDNAAVTNVLSKHADKTGRRFLYYGEKPAQHWFPGEGIGVAWWPRR